MLIHHMHLGILHTKREKKEKKKEGKQGEDMKINTKNLMHNSKWKSTKPKTNTLFQPESYPLTWSELVTF